MVPVRGYTTLAAGRGFGLLPPLPRWLLVVPFLPVNQCGTWYTIFYRLPLYLWTNAAHGMLLWFDHRFLPVNQCGTWYAFLRVSSTCGPGWHMVRCFFAQVLRCRHHREATPTLFCVAAPHNHNYSSKVSSETFSRSFIESVSLNLSLEVSWNFELKFHAKFGILKCHWEQWEW